MNRKDISNLKRQISRRSRNGVEREMRYLLSCRCTFRCVEGVALHGHAARYLLMADGVAVGEFDYFAKGSRPHYALALAWKLSGATKPWEDFDSINTEPHSV